MWWPGEPGQRRCLHHAPADGGRRQDQGRPGSPEEARGRGCHRGRQQRPSGVRHQRRGPEERHHRRPLKAFGASEATGETTVCSYPVGRLPGSVDDCPPPIDQVGSHDPHSSL
nr:hypothetical protein [Mycolicibacterium sp. P9-64]